MSAFAEIGARSNFSFLQGASDPEDMVETASKLGLAAIGLADRNTVAGVVRAHQAAKVAGLKFHPGSRLVFSDETPDMLAYPVNRKGWAHLCRLLSQGNLRAEKGTCELYEADLMEWANDMLFTILPPADQDNQALEALLSRLKARAPGRVYLGLSPRYDGNDRLNFGWLSVVGANMGIPLIATNEPLYHDVSRRPLSDIVAAIRHHVTVANAGLLLAANAERHLKGRQDIAHIFRDHPQAIETVSTFISQLKFSLDELQYQYPDESKDGETPTQTLKRLTYEGAAWRYPNGVPEKVSNQIVHELALIERLHYEPYFLTVRHIMEFARSKGILCQGRGSAANSTVCFCLRITEVDPALSELLFERFVSPERDEPPDIDVDFEHERREEVIQYIYDHYGHARAGLAAAVTTYRARSAGRETAKAMGLSEDVQAAMSASIWGWSSSALTEKEARAAGLDTSDPTTRMVLDNASTLMGFPRHLTQHSGGFVITHDRLDEIVPIMPTAMEGRTMVEWDKDDLDALKILKIDVLALGMLTAIAKSFQLLADHYDLPMTIPDVPKEQKYVYDMITRADTIGTFQVESRAQMSMLPRLKPKEFYDLVIEVAIVRPGPIQGGMVHPYLKRRQGLEKVDYPSKALESVLSRTLGVPLFQEQAMQIAIVAAGFSPAKADKLRRAMATFRRTGTIGNFRTDFIAGMVRNGYTEDFAERCFKQIEGFGDYGFPESHAASFALLVYISAWLKATYPDVFCTALLNSQPMGFYAPAQLVRDAREHGVEVRAPDINLSFWGSTLEKNAFNPARMEPRHREMAKTIATRHAVRLGFHQIKGLKEDDMNRLTAARSGGYKSVRELWLRSGLTRAVIERLADADCFRSIGLDRRQALWEARALDKKSAAESMPLFEATQKSLTEIPDFQPEPTIQLPVMPVGEHVLQDYRYLSLSLKAHPVSFLRSDFTARGIVASRALQNLRNGQRLTVAGLVLVRQRPGTAKGVIFMTLEDETGVVNVIVWKDIFEKYRTEVMSARLVRIRGKLQSAQGVTHVVAEHIENISGTLARLEEKASAMAPPAIAAGKNRNEGVPANLMPKGRNFH
ncbi:error-prone DNA polymerase [Rhizobium sp. L1K21]|uniref:error-prone DNA polymerase n=1 Tax=Rhizobium sp. L1K21 TaxID=2954933 RepID=UPI0020935BC2|nr:error-prone DNA polymerase [Rhizobium sp. L1K21]MCO6184816.1 error-prone DNA polymerase [Rhizobium sp. L1K21]